MGSMMALRIELQDAAGPMKIVQVPISCLFQSIPNLQMMALKCSAKVFFYFCLRCVLFVFAVLVVSAPLLLRDDSCHIYA